MDDERDDRGAPPGMPELDVSWKLFEALRALKTTDTDRGRKWATAATMAEQLYAWIGYVVTLADDD